MKEKFEKVKLFFKDHKDEIFDTVLITGYGVGAYVVGFALGRLFGQREGLMICNKTWMDFAEKCSPKED